MSTMTLLGIDIGKHSFHLHDQDAQGHQVLRKKTNRGQLLSTLAQLAALVGGVVVVGGDSFAGGAILGNAGEKIGEVIYEGSK